MRFIPSCSLWWPGVCERLLYRWRGEKTSWIWFPPRLFPQSDQRLKVESMCPLQQIYLNFQFSRLLNCPLCSPARPRTLRYILMPIRSVRLTATGRYQGGGQHYVIPAPLSPRSLRNTLAERERSIYYNRLMSSRAINSLIIIICLIKLFASLSMGVTQISQWKKQ